MATPIEIEGANETAVKTSVSRPSKISGGMRVKEFLYLCLENWLWFVISIAVCLACAYVYIKKSQPTYRKTASILIKIDEGGRSVKEGSLMFADLGIASNNSHIMDEYQIMRSPDMMRDVVRKLNLNMMYSTEGKFRSIPLYGSLLPVQVTMPDLGDEDYAAFKLDLKGNGEYTITDMSLRGKALEHSPIAGRIGTPVRTPMGTVNVAPGQSYKGNEEMQINVTHNTVKGAAAGISGGLGVEVDEHSFNMLNLSMVDWSPERAQDILKQLIASYSDRWMQEKRTLADNTSKFIEERVQLLHSELGDVDSDISEFKSANLVPDINAAASLAMSQASQSTMVLKDLRNQEYMAKYIRNYLRNTENTNKLLPSAAGFSSSMLSGQIGQYNAKILERNSLVAQSSASNPLVNQLDQELTAIRGALLASLDNELVALHEQIKSTEGMSGTATSKIASNPRQAKYLLSVERQQKVKESLYLYLLQKREENQLDQAFTSYNTRIVREPDGSNGPIAPNKAMIWLTGFVIGLAIPVLYLFQRELSVHVVRGRKDIADMKIPLAGELPLHSKKQKLPKFSDSNKKSTPIMAVKENCRNSINEAFRVLRTNLEFMFANNSTSRVVMLTSSNPGSGKTFVTYNLAKSFAIKGKKVIVLDLDMRKASLSKYVDSPETGISDYLANRVNDITSIIKRDKDCKNMAVIPVGTIPPNPTELLFSDRLHALIEDLRVHYDYVFIDCPPIEVVADSTIISKYADHTLFVIRAGILDLSMLPIIDEMYEKGQYPMMSLVLNGTVNPRNSYARRYGNPYSYGYGYGTGYAYASED
jgi:capsular exopolysaccharide synthesis family protein